MILLRALARLVSFLLLAAIAVAGLAVAVFSIEGGGTGLSIPGLAHDVHLPQLRHRAGGLLAQLEAPGGVALLSLLAGVAVVAVGLLLLAGALVPRRERLVQLDSGEHGDLSARRAALAQVARALVEPVRGVSRLKVRVRASRSGGGRLKVRADRPPATPEAELDAEMTERLTALTEPFELTAHVSSRVASGAENVT
jgi:hypothetical protein